MYVAVVPNRNSPPAILLRESFRENGKVCNRTIANLSGWPPPLARFANSALIAFSTPVVAVSAIWSQP